MVKAQVDSVRHTKGLSSLISDSILYLAAQDQAEYLKDKSDIGHAQKTARKKTPQDRVDFYGASNYFAGENVLSYPLATTYIATARQMVKGWVNSPGHYKNIIHTPYQITGVALVPHQKNGNIIAVQVFARVLFKYSFEPNKTLFPYDTTNTHHEKYVQNNYVVPKKKEKLPWKLKPIRNEFTNKSKLAQAAITDQIDLRPSYSNDMIQLYSSTPEQMMKLLKHRKDGIVVELVDYEPYHCSNPAYYTALSRRNGNSSTSGQLLKPIYKQDLLRNLKLQKYKFKKEKRQQLKPLRFKFSKQASEKRKFIRKTHWEPDETRVNVGEWSQADSGTYLAVNFLLVHKKRIIMPLYFTGACGDWTFEDTIQTETHFSTPHFTSFTTDSKQFDFQIPFTRNNTHPDSASMLAIRDTLLNYQIDGIRIMAFASVEGLNQLNEKLYLTRGENIITHIRQYTDTATTIQIKTGENWPLFYKQLQGTKFISWKNRSRSDIKQDLQQPAVLSLWEKSLNEQRKAHVYVKAHVWVRDTLTYLQHHRKKMMSKKLPMYRIIIISYGNSTAFLPTPSCGQRTILSVKNIVI